MDLEFWATTDVGRVRDHNEDNFLVDKRLRLFVVCDGMGGHAAGEVASAMSVKVVREVVSSGRELFERLDRDPDNLDHRKGVLDLCERAIHEASQRIWQSAQEDPSKRGMGTTCSFLLLLDGRGFIGHVGDSRIYLNRGGQIHQITEDHSLLNEMLRLGKIKKGEEHLLPHRNAVTRAVGVNEFVEVDTFEFDVFSGDQFLLCSDGLCGYFKTEDAVLGLMDAPTVKDATERCINFANQAGGKDNITSIIIRVSGEVGKQRDLLKAIEVLKTVPFFQYLAYKELVQVVNLGHRQEVKAGLTFCDDLTLTRTLAIVINGSFDVTQDRDRWVASAGEFFGETSLIDENAVPFAAVAREDSVVLRLDVDHFMELLRHDHELAVKVLWNFLHNFTVRMRELSTRPRQLPSQDLTPARHVVADEDLKTTAAVDIEIDVDRTMDIDTEHIRKLAAFDHEAKPQPFSRDEVTLGSTLKGHGPVPSRPQMQTPVHAAPTPGGATEDLDWEGIERLLHDDVSDEDLRKTVRIDQLTEERTMPSLDAIDDKPAFTGISGESVSKTTAPKAQVFKRNKLVVGAEPEPAPEDESLAERLRKKREAIKKDIEDVS